MPITTVLFDLDGTLLPMDQETFVKQYFGLLARRLAPHGYEAQALVRAIWKGTDAMVSNDGSCPNEARFWESFCADFGPQAMDDLPHFDAYYRTDFARVQEVCGFAPQAAAVVRLLRERGIRLALATNPIFPAIATEQRIRWAGLAPEDFALITTYENSRFCKPNLDYYRAVTEALGVSPEECLMVGNDVQEDMAAEALGMQVFLLTDCLIDRAESDLSRWPHGDFAALETFLRQLFA